MLWVRIIIIGALTLLSLTARAEGKEKCGPYDGVDLTNDPELLGRILSAHREWLAGSRRCEYDPYSCMASLCRANLSEANLQNANLSKADLAGANLSKADLSSADLSGTFLESADLSNAGLQWANLSGADLVGANLSEAILRVTDLNEAVLRDADLSKADLRSANLSGANLGGAILSDANLWGAILIDANLGGANLSKANLFSADLRRAHLEDVDLSEADLRNVDLSEAKLLAVDLTNARVANAELWGAQYEPTTAPAKGHLSGITGLRDVWFQKGEQGGLVLLRAALKDVGLRELEREATFAIERGKTSHAPPLEKWLRRVFFEWTSGYGLHYGRPIAILLILIPVFAIAYAIPISTVPKHANGRSGIYYVVLDGGMAVNKRDESEGVVSFFDKPFGGRLHAEGIRVFGYAFYFSLLSAFHIGWRDLNVGNWIARIQPREYTLRPKGWVRTVSGIQSLISIYLLALWMLTYFGRPFE
jgi:uncharacterized protein YjbI with pentapeptide repeats